MLSKTFKRYVFLHISTVKNPSATRWSARANACISFKEQLQEINDALIFIEGKSEPTLYAVFT